MHASALTPDLDVLLVEHRFHDQFSEAVFADLRQVLRYVAVDPGDVVLRQGDPDREAYPILAFDKYVPIIEIGYAATKERVAAWQRVNAAQANG